jgi:hypothetical protein
MLAANDNLARCYFLDLPTTGSGETQCGQLARSFLRLQPDLDQAAFVQDDSSLGYC